MNVKIKRNYWTVMALFVSGVILPLAILLVFVTGAFGTILFVIYGIAFLALYFNILYEFRLLSTLYHRYKIAVEDPRFSSNPTQQVISNALSNITFKDLFKIRQLKSQERRKMRYLDQNNDTATFELLNGGNVSVVVYNRGKLHTYAVVIPLTENSLLILNNAFTQSKDEQTRRIRNEFEKWANAKGINFDYLKLEEERAHIDDDKLG
jgi:hypothetical protein